MRKLLFLLAICINTYSYAQHTVIGVAKDAATGELIPYVTASLLSLDSTVVTGAIASEDGKFTIHNVAVGNYLLQVSFLGYERTFRNMSVPAQSDLGDILLSESATMLAEVVITSRRPLVEMRVDRMIVNVSSNLITAGRNINEVLRDVPGLHVDNQGSITLYGRAVIIHINGRPTRLPAAQVAQLLSGMQGDQVDRVELIANPSSRYEASDGSSIVNIQLKRDASLGVNGSVSSGIGYTEYDWLFREALNLNYRSRNINVYGNYGYNYQPIVMDVEQYKNFTAGIPVTYAQHSTSTFVAPNHTLRIGTDWFVNPKQTIGFLFTGMFGTNRSYSQGHVEISPLNIARIDSTTQSTVGSGGQGESQMYNLNYRLVTNREGEELTADLDYGRVNVDGNQNLKNLFFDNTGSEQREKEEFRQNTVRNVDVFSFGVNYVRLFANRLQLGAGAKTGYTETDNTQLYEDLFSEQWIHNDNFSNSFSHKEQVTAAYVTYGQQWNKFSAMAGLRAEYTSTSSKSVTLDTTFSHNYIDFFPNAYLQYQIGDMHSINLSYARRIIRPNYSHLNPFRSYTDAYTYQSGNPNLKPVYQQTFILSYRYRRLIANAVYSTFKNSVNQEWVQDDETHITALIPKNNSKRTAYTIYSQLSIPVSKAYTVTPWARTTLYDESSWYSNEPFSKKFIAGEYAISNSFTILPTLRVQAYFYYILGGWGGVTKYSNNWYINTQIEKTFFENRLSVVLNCSDLFSSQMEKATIRFKNVDQILIQDFYPRTTVLTIRYSFGSGQIRATRNRNVGIEEEIGRAR
jgi:hypothetical protein